MKIHLFDYTFCINSFILFLLLITSVTQSGAQDVFEGKNKDYLKNWIYNDMEKAIKQSRENKKPLLVLFRCVP